MSARVLLGSRHLVLVETGCTTALRCCCDVSCSSLQAQEGLIVALEDTDLLLLDGDTYASILKTGAHMCMDGVCIEFLGLLISQHPGLGQHSSRKERTLCCRCQ